MDFLSAPDPRPAPSGLLLALTSTVFSMVAGYAWLLLVFEAFFAAPWSSQWLLSGLALPGAMVGSIATHTTKRWWPFFAGLAITLVPIVLYAVLPGSPLLGAGAD